MWKILMSSDTVEVDGRPYAVRRVAEGRIWVFPPAVSIAPCEPLPVFPVLVLGKQVEIRSGDQIRQAQVVAIDEGVTVLGPARMQDSQDGTDCPYCWQQDVLGEKTGMGFGMGAGPNRPKPIPTLRHECPGCRMAWSSPEWQRLVRKTL